MGSTHVATRCASLSRNFSIEGVVTLLYALWLVDTIVVSGSGVRVTTTVTVGLCQGFVILLAV